MAGTYTEGQSKLLSGVYTLIKAAMAATILGARGVVAFPFTSNWGPVNKLVNIGGYGKDFNSLYNASNTALTAKKIYELAFLGNPKTLLAYRLATGLAAKGTCTLDDAGAADSIVLSTKYPSDRAFVAVVKDGLAGGTKVIDIMEGSVKLCTVEDATLAGLVAKLNLTDYVTAVAGAGGLLPANVAGSNFAGGNNGSVATVTEYLAFLDELEADGTANAFALDGVTDETILDDAEAWTKRVRAEGIYIDFVRGGAAAWDTDGGAAANVKSVAINHRGIINVGNGADGYTAADVAIYVAARAGSIALNRTLTDEPTQFTAVNKKLKPSERNIAKMSGTLVLIQDGGRVLIDEGINTLTTPTGDETIEFSKIRVSTTLDYIARDLEAFGKEYKRTRSNTPAARETYAATVETDYLRPLEALEVLQLGSFYVPDPEYHGKAAIFTPKLDEAYFYSNITPVDSMEKIYQKIGVQF